MKKLPTSITHWKCQWDQIERTGDIALFKQTNIEYGCVHYNVINIRKRKEQVWPNGNVTLARESLPSESEWGIYGQTYMSLLPAKNKFDEWVKIEGKKPLKKSKKKV